jgi:hypothetical protein
MHCALFGSMFGVSKEGQGFEVRRTSFISNKVLSNTTCDMRHKQVAFLFFLCCSISPLVELDSWES